MDVSLTHLLHPLSSNPLLHKGIDLAHNPSPPVHSSLALSTVASVESVQKCCFNHISLLLHLMHVLHLVELMDQLPWIVQLLHRRGSGGDTRALKERGKQSRVRCWRRCGACVGG